MLQRVEIENFRSLRSVKVPLRPLTVLIGANDSGKSAFLAALQQFVNGLGFNVLDHWRHDVKARIVISLTTARGTTTFGVPGSENPEVLADLRPLAFFHLLAQGIPMESQGHSDDQGPPVIHPSGENVPVLLDYLLRRDPKRFFSFVAALRNLVPGLEDMLIATPNPHLRRLDLLIENGLLIQGYRASAGIRLLVVFLALAYHPARPKVILLEEPEAGFHPKRLGTVMDLLRDITQGKYGGNASQVILTTHSPYLLDRVDLEKDQVLVFRRNEDGSRTAEPADAGRLKLFLDEFLLGEVWYNQDEEGLVARRQ
jgi:predicted ATPase